jgi:hypothetical protein
VASLIPVSDGPQTPSSQSPSSGYSDDELLSPGAVFSNPVEEGLATLRDSRRLEQFFSGTRTATGAEDKSSRGIENAQYWQRQWADLKWQAKFCQEELRLSKERNADLERKLASKENAIEILKRPNEASITGSLERYITEVEILQSKLKDRAILGQFTKHPRQYPIGPDRKEFEDDMSLIETGILNLSASPETMEYCSEADFDIKGEDLSSLCHGAFGESNPRLPRVRFQSILRALTSVAICKWVFESDFDEPYFANSHRGDTILMHLATQGT